MLYAEPPFNESVPFIDDVKEVVVMFRGVKVAGICDISAELLKAVDEAMINRLYAVLTAEWH